MLALILCCSGVGDVRAEEAARWAERIAAIAEENHLRAPFGTVHFREEVVALEGITPEEFERARHAFTGEGRYVFDSPNRRFEMARSFAGGALQAGSGAAVAVGPLSTRLLSDGRWTLEDLTRPADRPGEFAHRLTVRSGQSGLDASVHDLASMGDLQRDSYVVRLLRSVTERTPGFGLVSVDEGAAIDGTPVVLFEFLVPRWRNQPGVRPETARVSLWIDVERGGVTRQVVEHTEDHPPLPMRHRDLRQVAGRSWVPFVEEWQRYGDGFLRRRTIESIDLEHRPEAGAFALEFPEPVEAFGEAGSRRYGARRVWDLGAFREFTDEWPPAVPRPAARARIKPAPRPWWFYPAIASAVGAVMVAHAVWRVVARNLPGRRGGPPAAEVTRPG